MSERILLIVESPNKVKTIKQYLPSNYIVMASFGHISQIKDGGSYWNTGIDPKDNFKINFAIDNDKDNKDRVAKLKEQVKIADKVILATDPDREGEAISWSLRKFLNVPEKKLERVTFHEITKNAVLKALEHPRKIDENLVASAHTRSAEDKIIGYVFTPQARKDCGAKSVGRCQSAGLMLIVDRDEEFRNFESKKYYELWLYFNKRCEEFKAKYIGTKDTRTDKFDDVQVLQSIVDACEPPFVILNSSTKERKEYPKPPFITSTLQQEVFNKFKIKVKDCNAIAQRLFEGIDVGNKHVALITYIRTDSPEFAPEFIPILEDFVKQHYGDDWYAPIRKAKKQENAQDGHEAIRCVDLDMTPEKLSQYISDKTLLKVYDIIYRRTIATMMKPCITNETTYTIECNGHLFEFTSREEKFDGFKRVYKYSDAPENEDEDSKESRTSFSRGEQLNVTSLDSVERETKPRPRFNEATYVKALEDSGIGRPSTYEKTLETNISPSRGYCTVEDGYLVPTEKGIQVVKYLRKTFPTIFNINYTREMEKKLDDIENGKVDKLTVLNDFYNEVESEIKKVNASSKEKEISDEVCPLCGAQMIVRTGQYGKFLGCSKYPKCKGIKKL